MVRAGGEVALAVLLEIGDADAELLPLYSGAVGPESLVFADDRDVDGGDGGPFTGVSDGRVLRWVDRALLLRARPVSFHRRRPPFAGSTHHAYLS